MWQSIRIKQKISKQKFPELNGSSAFSIGSNRKFEVTIPYLINTESENGVSLEYLQKSAPKLLLTVYPKEIYLKLPEARMTEKQ